MFVRSVRGAVSIEKDSPDYIDKGVNELIEKLIKANSIEEENIISIQFTITNDLKSRNPAASLRKSGFKNVPLFCSQEPEINGSMERVVRVLITAESDTRSSMIPVYIKGAEKLRPDIF